VKRHLPASRLDMKPSPHGEVGINLDTDGFAEYVSRCSILHITKLEDIPHPVAG
jgi:hypothetical protein